MGLRFRPYPGLTVFVVVMLAILIGLGVWQLQRLQWKLNLIATMNAHMAAAPVPPQTLLALPAAQAQYRRVVLSGHFDNAKEAYLFTTGPGGEPVYHVLTPFHLSDGAVLLVDRGFVPKAKLPPASRLAVDGPVRLVGIWRSPEAPGFFTPEPDRAHSIWYARDLAGIASADRVKLAAPVIIEADATPNPGGWPKGGQTVIDLPNNHFQYALTWFGLAAGLFGVYLAYHMSKGRLTFRV